MVKKKNNNIIIIPKSLTLKEAAIRLEINAIKVKLLDENVWADFSKNILLKKNKTELVHEYFGCSKEAAEYLVTLSLAELMLNTPEIFEQERRTLEAGKGFIYPTSAISSTLKGL